MTCAELILDTNLPHIYSLPHIYNVGKSYLNVGALCFLQHWQFAIHNWGKQFVQFRVAIIIVVYNNRSIKSF